MVNAHFHGTSTVTRGLFMDMPVAQWLNDSPQGQIQQRFIRALGQCTEEERVQLSLYEYSSMLKQGITTVFDCRLFQQDYKAKKRQGVERDTFNFEADNPSQLDDQPLLRTALPCRKKADGLRKVPKRKPGRRIIQPLYLRRIVWKPNWP
ncbi:MAG: hypothetical protein ACLSA6_17335 [Holdemania massiliensis]